MAELTNFRRRYVTLFLCSIAALLSASCHHDGYSPQRMTSPSFAQSFCINGRCGVINQTANQLVPFEQGYQRLFLSPDGRAAVASDGGSWRLLQMPGAVVTRSLRVDGKVEPVRASGQSQENMGLLAFQRGGKWGLMDFSGREVESPRFDDISTSGVGRMAIAYASGDKWGLLNFNGEEITAAVYDNGFSALDDDLDRETGFILAHSGDQHWLIRTSDHARWKLPTSDLSYAGNRAWLVSIGEGDSRPDGLLDAERDVEVLSQKYRSVRALTEDRFVFAAKRDPAAGGAELNLGVMDAAGKVLIQPGRFSSIRADRSGHYLLASRDNDAVSLFDIDGRLLLESAHKLLAIDEAHGIVRGYEGAEELAGIYDLQGKTVLSVVSTPCGAKQLRDGSGKPVWPLDLHTYCTS